jgi:hypothetical protein
MRALTPLPPLPAGGSESIEAIAGILKGRDPVRPMRVALQNYAIPPNMRITSSVVYLLASDKT